MIILNRVFSGDYLDKNLGHEVINFFRADNKKHYIYITAYGTIRQEAKNAEGVLLVRSGVGAGRLEILGYASGLDCELSDDFFKIKNQKESSKAESKKQKDLIEKTGAEIKYGGVLLNRLFNLYEENAIYITFSADKFRKPKNRLYLINSNSGKNKENIEANEAFIEFRAKTSLKEYLEVNTREEYSITAEDMKNLEYFINNDNLWEDYKCEMITDDKLKELKLTPNILSSIGKQYDELSFSNWICSILRSDRNIFVKFCDEVLKQKISKDADILREYKNIDIFIKDKETAIVIENKIKSGINGSKYDLTTDTNKDQLDKYKKIASEEHNGHKKYFLFVPTYHELANRSEYKEYEVITYEKLHTFFKSNISKVDKEKTKFYEEFVNALELHARKYNNELYEIAMSRLAEKILEMKENN